MVLKFLSKYTDDKWVNLLIVNRQEGYKIQDKDDICALKCTIAEKKRKTKNEYKLKKIKYT